MNQMSLRVKQIILKDNKEQKSLQTYIEASLSIDSRDVNIKFSEGILMYDESIELSKSTQKYIKDILSAFVAGITARTFLIVNVPTDECESINCKLEE